MGVFLPEEFRYRGSIRGNLGIEKVCTNLQDIFFHNWHYRLASLDERGEREKIAFSPRPSILMMKLL